MKSVRYFNRSVVIFVGFVLTMLVLTMVSLHELGKGSAMTNEMVNEMVN